MTEQGEGGIVGRKRARFVSPTGYCTVLYVEHATQAASQPGTGTGTEGREENKK